MNLVPFVCLYERKELGYNKLNGKGNSLSRKFL